MREIGTNDFQSMVWKGNKIVLDFYSTECPPCDALAPKYEALAKEYGDQIQFLKIHRQGNRELAVSLGVTSSPSVLFFDKGERVGDVLKGEIEMDELIKGVEKLIGEKNRAVFDFEVREDLKGRVCESGNCGTP
jgi:thioredoxin reductase (NADPH)